MIEISIPGYKNLQLKHLVLDYNGTIACDGELLTGMKGALENLSDKLQVHVLTADTYGKVRDKLKEISCDISTLGSGNVDAAKLDYVLQLGSEFTVCIGNGRNDRLMLKEAALGIAVVQKEGVFAETLMSADVVCTNIISALGLLTNPLRLIATLRS
jgi:soluble P-type ATPase